MNEIRSWDGWDDDCGSANASRRYGYDILVRVVAWPEGAPKQEDVPHVGEKRKWLTEVERLQKP